MSRTRLSGWRSFAALAKGSPDREASVEPRIHIVTALSDRPGHPHPDLGVAPVGHDDVLLPVHEGVHLAGETERMDGNGLAFPERLRRGLPIRIGLPDSLHPALETAAEGSADPLRLDHAVEFFQKGPDVADDAQVHGAVPADLLRLDVRLDELGVFPEDVAEEVEEAEPAPQKEDQVGARKGEEGRAGTDGEGGLEAEGVGVGDGSPAGIAREDGNAGLLDEYPEGLPRIGIPDAASGDDDRGVRRLEHRHDLPGAFGIQSAGTPPGSGAASPSPDRPSR